MKLDAFVIWYFGFLVAVTFLCGFIPMPKVFKRKDLGEGFPWGCYPDAVADEESL